MSSQNLKPRQFTSQNQEQTEENLESSISTQHTKRQNSSQYRFMGESSESDDNSIVSARTWNKKKNSKKPLKIFKTASYQNLPSIAEVDDTYQSFRKSFEKLGKLTLHFFGFIFQQIWEFFKVIFSVFSLVLKKIGIVFLTIIVFINKKCLKKINKKDPFKRNKLNINYSRLSELNEIKDYYDTKPFNVVLDLDETMVYSSTKKRGDNSIECPVTFESGTKMTYYVQKRPYLDEFLQEISKYYTITVYTASLKEYADAIINKIDKNNLIKKRYYRESCIKHPQGYIKDLSIVNKDMSRIVMIDNSSFAVQLNQENAFIVPCFKGKEDPECCIFQKFQDILQYFAAQKTDFRDLIDRIKYDYF